MSPFSDAYDRDCSAAEEQQDRESLGLSVLCPGCHKRFLNASVHLVTDCYRLNQPLNLTTVLNHVLAAHRLLPDEDQYLAARLALSVAHTEVVRLTDEHRRLAS